MKKITYVLSKQSMTSSILYSVEVIEEGVRIQVIPTAFTKEGDAQKLVSLCNEYDVDPIHVPDIMEDMLYNIWLKECESA